MCVKTMATMFNISLMVWERVEYVKKCKIFTTSLFDVTMQNLTRPYLIISFDEIT